MNKFTNPLNNVRIAAPCKADWNEMIGNQRQRFCGACKLNVYNLSGMTKQEAENLLIGSEGRLCVRFYKRADGSVLTKDCPVGWQAIKRRASKMATAAASLVFGLFSGLGLNAYFNQPKESILMGDISYESTIEINEQPVEPLVGEIAVMQGRRLEPVMGKMAVNNTNALVYPVAGGISNIGEVRKQVKEKRRR
jgi:hypothetical protein